MAAEQALINAKLTEFRRVGQRIMVPAKDVDRYNAALLEFDAMPTDLGSQMLSKLDSMGPFTTDKQRQEMKEAMLLQEMRRMLRAVPDIEDARVVVANAGRRATWSQKSRVTATVEVKPRGGRELSQTLVHALRTAVASMVPDLQPADVTIFDRVHAVSYTGESADDPFDGKLIQRIRQFTQHYKREIQNDLSYIPNVGVTVQVDIENVKSTVTKSQTVDPKKIAPLVESVATTSDNLQQRMPRGEAGVKAMRPSKLPDDHSSPDRTRQQNDSTTNTISAVSFEVSEKALIAAMPKAVQVSVSIPREYYRDVAAQRKANGEQDASKTDQAQIEKDILLDVQKSVEKLIPAGSPKDAIVVKSIDLVEKPAIEPKVPWMDQILLWSREWAGAVGLAMFAAWVLWTLRKMAPAATAASETDDMDPLDSKRLKMPSAASETQDEAKAKEPTRRDLIQTIVKDNPEMTASVIGKWLQAAK
jgi:flagellar M-ring protein FliF